MTETLERELGTGGMATVYLAEDLKHKRKVAVKVLRPDSQRCWALNASSKRSRPPPISSTRTGPDLAAAPSPERFVREIEITASLAHPHIVPLYDSGEGEHFLIIRSPPSSASTAHAPASVGLPRPRRPA